VAPTIESVTAAASGAASSLPADTDYRISIVNAPGADAYPISSFTYLLVYAIQDDRKKADALLGFMRWYLREGEKSAASLDYAPLPPAIVAQLEQRLGTITVAGE
jgi:phosphate transport system substrate-binding protein